ncbi:MAG: flippase, partial [Candidatus Hydrogenedentes bacterium]|nr:flippase [Candidatus Hydrogenedentota bacterium]
MNKTQISMTSLLERAKGRGLGAVLARGAAGSFALNISWAGLGFASQVLLARMMGTSDYGCYAYAFSWLMVLSFAGTLGFDKSLLRFLSIYSAEEQWGRYRGLLRYSHAMVLATSLIVGIGIAATAWILRGVIAQELLHTLWITSTIVPILAFAMLRQGAVQALKHPVQAQFGLMLARPLLVIALATGLWRFQDRSLNAPQGMAIYLCAVAAVLTLNSFVYRRRMPAAAAAAIPAYRRREWLSMAAAMALMAGVAMFMRQVSILMIGALESPAEAGLYSAATRLVDLVIFGLIAVNMIGAPIFAQLHAQGKRDELQRVLTLASWGIFALCVPVSLFLIVFGRFLLGLFGEDFTAAYPALLILVCGQLFKALAGSVGYLLTMTGHQKQAAIVICAVAILSVALNWLLIPRYGLSGAAIATVLTAVAWNSAMLVLVHRYLGLN